MAQRHAPGSEARASTPPSMMVMSRVEFRRQREMGEVEQELSCGRSDLRPAGRPSAAFRVHLRLRLLEPELVLRQALLQVAHARRGIRRASRGSSPPSAARAGTAPRRRRSSQEWTGRRRDGGPWARISSGLFGGGRASRKTREGATTAAGTGAPVAGSRRDPDPSPRQRQAFG